VSLYLIPPCTQYTVQGTKPVLSIGIVFRRVADPDPCYFWKPDRVSDQHLSQNSETLGAQHRAVEGRGRSQ
jgi:hypothetical protein